jgi:hypothetical protein
MPAYSSMGFKKKGRSTFPESYQREIRGIRYQNACGCRYRSGTVALSAHTSAHATCDMTKPLDERKSKRTDSMCSVV